MARKLPTRSIHQQAAILDDLRNQNVRLPEGVELRDDRDRKFFAQAIIARAKGQWSDVELAMAANLARSQADIERLCAEIAREGDVIPLPNGCVIINPKHKVLDLLHKRVMSLAKILHIHADAKFGQAKDGWKKESTARELREAVKSAEDDDDLINLKSVQ